MDAHDTTPKEPGPTALPPDSGVPQRLGARYAALRTLSDLRLGRRTARDSIDSLAAGHSLSEQDVALTHELVMGVMRHRLTLSRLLGSLSSRGWKGVNQRLQDILMLGAYQLIWLDGIPAFAAVNEAVNQAKAEGGQSAGRFVNAVLRQLLREIEDRRVPIAEGDPMRVLRVDSRYSCQFKRAVLPDPAAKQLEYLADSTSHPLWLVTRWVKSFGLEKAWGICMTGLSRPPVFVRPNRLKTDAAQLVQRLSDENADAQATADGQAVILARAAGMARLPGFRDGWFQPQDRTAMRVVEQMELRRGATVVDLCAGLGTKATQAAEIMQNTGLVVACDKDESKLAMIRENAARLGISIIRTIALPGDPTCGMTPNELDWILVDAPCSNTGVLARRPEARYRLNAKSIESLASIQKDLMDQAARLAGVRTRLMYSTCSIEPEENEQVSLHFAATNPGWRLAASELTLPSCGSDPAGWHDGGYWAAWVRE